MAEAGYYDDGTGRQRWWDGSQWTDKIIKTAHKMLQIIPFLLLNQRSPEIVQR